MKRIGDLWQNYVILIRFLKKLVWRTVWVMWSVLTDFGLFNRLFQKKCPKMVFFLPKKSGFWSKGLFFTRDACDFCCKILRRPLHGFSSVHIIKLNQWEWFNSIIISMWNHLCDEIHAQILFKIAKS